MFATVFAERPQRQRVCCSRLKITGSDVAFWGERKNQSGNVTVGSFFHIILETEAVVFFSLFFFHANCGMERKAM